MAPASELHGHGDEFSARFETLDGYTVIFDQKQKAYCFARQDADGQLISTGAQVQRGGSGRPRPGQGRPDE